MVLLIAQGLLVLVFLMVGVMKNVKSTEELSEKMVGWMIFLPPR